jgi:hypothetical protein
MEGNVNKLRLEEWVTRALSEANRVDPVESGTAIGELASDTAAASTGRFYIEISSTH